MPAELMPAATWCHFPSFTGVALVMVCGRFQNRKRTLTVKLTRPCASSQTCRSVVEVVWNQASSVKVFGAAVADDVARVAVALPLKEKAVLASAVSAPAAPL